MHVRDHGLDGVEDLVLAACLEDQCYDRQCEGSRAEWTYDLFKGTPAYARFAGPILAALARSTDDDDGDQLRELAGLMACGGDLQAASALRSFVWKQAFSDDSVLGAIQICALDGMPAAVELARRLGTVLQDDPEASVDNLSRLIEDALPYDAVLAELKRVAGSDVAVAAYVVMEEENNPGAGQESGQYDLAAREQQRKDAFMSEYPIDVILAAASGKKRGNYRFLDFGRWACKADLDRVLDRLHIENDTDACERLLWVFRKAPLPRLDERVWELASHSVPEIRYAAVVALSGISHPRVHELARTRLADPEFSSDVFEDVELFKNNFQAGDEVLILAALERQAVDGTQAHALGCSEIEVCTSASSPALAGVAQWVYRTNPCAICRREIVELLLEWRCLPADIALECRFDALKKLRDLAHKIA